MTAHRRVIEDEADAIAARASKLDAMRARWEADLVLLDQYEGDDIADIRNGLKDLSSDLFMAAVQLQATAPDLDNTYPGRSAPGSY